MEWLQGRANRRGGPACWGGVMLLSAMLLCLAGMAQVSDAGADPGMRISCSEELRWTWGEFRLMEDGRAAVSFLAENTGASAVHVERLQAVLYWGSTARRGRIALRGDARLGPGGCLQGRILFPAAAGGVPALPEVELRGTVHRAAEERPAGGRACRAACRAGVRLTRVFLAN